MFLSDKTIIELCNNEKPLIEDAVLVEVKELDGKKLVSYGLSQNGYDVRIAVGTKLSINGNEDTTSVLDPKKYNDYLFKDNQYVYNDNEEAIVIPPKHFCLAHTVEKFNIPNDVTGILYCKSTYARLGMNMAPTVLKSGWSGQLVLEIYNQTELPLVVYPNEGIGTIYFTKHDGETIKPYHVDGKYNNQTGITGAKHE